MTLHQTHKTQNTVIAIYKDHTSADAAVKQLAEADISMEKLSVIGQGYHSEEKVVGFYNTGERMKLWGKFGAFWGGLWGLMVTGMYITVPAVGSVVVLGHLATMVLAVIEGAVVAGGLSALGASLFSIGIPKDSILQYEQALKADGFMVLLEGSQAEIAHARTILDQTGTEQVDLHDYYDQSVGAKKIKAAV